MPRSGNLRIRETRRVTRSNLRPLGTGVTLPSTTTPVTYRDDRQAAIAALALVVRQADQFPGLSRASVKDLTMLATTWGLTLDAAKTWATSPGAAGDWNWSAVS